MVVQGLRGVQSVTNEIAVVPSQQVRDETIAADIVAALERSASVTADDVTVRVTDGKVTLSGTVPTSAAKRAARKAAVNTAGVKEVEDRIDVS